MIQILLDQGLSRSAADCLRNVGWDVIHACEVELSRATDLEILEYARQCHRIVITLDADFHTLLAVTNANSPSVVRIRQEGLNGSKLSSLLQRVWPEINAHLQNGAMVTITRTAIRIHQLPVSRDDKE